MGSRLGEGRKTDTDIASGSDQALDPVLLMLNDRSRESRLEWEMDVKSDRRAPAILPAAPADDVKDLMPLLTRD